MTDSGSKPTSPRRSLDAKAAIERLGSNPTAGLSSQGVTRRAAEHGPNALPEAAERSVFLLLLSQLKSLLIYILFVAVASGVLWTEELRKAFARWRRNRSA